jgi:hypothetical protein
MEEKMRITKLFEIEYEAEYSLDERTVKEGFDSAFPFYKAVVRRVIGTTDKDGHNIIALHSRLDDQNGINKKLYDTIQKQEKKLKWLENQVTFLRGQVDGLKGRQ